MRAYVHSLTLWFAILCRTGTNCAALSGNTFNSAASPFYSISARLGSSSYLCQARVLVAAIIRSKHINGFWPLPPIILRWRTSNCLLRDQMVTMKTPRRQRCRDDSDDGQHMFRVVDCGGC